MVYVAVLCDDNFDPDMTYQIDGETVADNRDSCETCEHYAKCMGFAKEFGRCNK